MPTDDTQVREAYKGWWQLNWNMPQNLPRLEALAAPERWGDPRSRNVRERYAVLITYLRETYVRCVMQGRAIEGVLGTERLRAFNTGLLTQDFDEIIACFKRVGDGGWNCLGFVDVGHIVDTELGRKLNAACKGALPKRATFLSDTDDVLFRDKGKDPKIRYEHIIRQRIYRFPPTYVARMGGLEAFDAERFCEDGIEHDEEIFSAGGHSTDDWLAQLPEYGCDIDVDTVYESIKVDLFNKVREAMKRAAATWSLAVPCWYPARQKVSLMLPLRMAGDEEDLAMVVMLENDGRYHCYTVLDLDTARADARLVTAPAKNWAFAEQDAKPSPGTELLELDDETPSLDACAYLAWGDPETVQMIVGGMTIGRGSATQPVEVKLEGDAYRTASRQHGQFVCHDGVWSFIDTSKLGTAVRRSGEWIALERGVPFELRDGDRLKLGKPSGTSDDVYRALVRFMLEEPLDDLDTPQL